MEDDRWFKVFKYSLYYIGVTPFSRNVSNLEDRLCYFNQLMSFLTMVLTIASQIKFVSLHIEDMELITSAATTISSATVVCLKLYVYIVNRDTIREQTHSLILNDYAMNLGIVRYVTNNEVEGEKLLELRKLVVESRDYLNGVWRMCFKLYFSSTASTISSFVMLPFVFMIFMFKTYTRILPFNLVFPWNVESSPAYEVTYLLEIYSSIIALSAFPALDALLGYLIGHIVRQLEILNFIMQHLNQLVGEAQEEGSEPWERDCTAVLAQCVHHYVKMKEFTQSINAMHKNFFLLQVLTSSVMICLCTFKVATLPPFSIIAISYYSFEMTTILQILLTCYLGQKLRDQSEKLELTVLEGWYKHGRRYRTDVVLFYSMLQQPLAMYAWGSLDLSLFTFSEVMRTSMSYFTLLMSFTE